MWRFRDNTVLPICVVWGDRSMGKGDDWWHFPRSHPSLEDSAWVQIWCKGILTVLRLQGVQTAHVVVWAPKCLCWSPIQGSVAGGVLSSSRFPGSGCFLSLPAHWRLPRGWATKYESCNFGDITYNLNTLIFAFKAGIHNIKMNGKMYAKNLTF